MKKQNKEYNPIYFENKMDMDKPIGVLIEELRNNIDKVRGKLFDIEQMYGNGDWLKDIQGGLTCMLVCMQSTKEELEKIEQKYPE